jgi:hypothetical protein
VDGALSSRVVRAPYLGETRLTIEGNLLTRDMEHEDGSGPSALIHQGAKKARSRKYE